MSTATYARAENGVHKSLTRERFRCGPWHHSSRLSNALGQPAQLFGVSDNHDCDKKELNPFELDHVLSEHSRALLIWTLSRLAARNLRRSCFNVDWTILVNNMSRWKFPLVLFGPCLKTLFCPSQGDMVIASMQFLMRIVMYSAYFSSSAAKLFSSLKIALMNWLPMAFLFQEVIGI